MLPLTLLLKFQFQNEVCHYHSKYKQFFVGNHPQQETPFLVTLAKLYCNLLLTRQPHVSSSPAWAHLSNLLNSQWLCGKEPDLNEVNAEDPGLIPGSGRFPGGVNGSPLQNSPLGNPMDRGAWGATVYRVSKSWLWLSNWAHTHPLSNLLILSIDQRSRNENK